MSVQAEYEIMRNTSSQPHGYAAKTWHNRPEPWSPGVAMGEAHELSADDADRNT